MKTILITGASQGIGEAFSRALMLRGHKVLGVARNEKKLQALQEEWGGAFVPIVADISTQEGREAIVSQARAVTSTLSLVHNAAIEHPLGFLKDIGLQDFRQQLAINLEAPLFLTQALLPCLVGQRVLHMSTGVAHFPLPGASGYSISKSALFMLYRAWKAEAPMGVSFGSVTPGAVDTPMFAELLSEKYPYPERYYGVKPHLLAPALVARFLVWLLLEVDDVRYSANEWSIYDTAHHVEWAEGAVIVNPFAQE